MASFDRRVYERWTPEAERWYIQYRPAALAWARRMDRSRPGNDWLTDTGATHDHAVIHSDFDFADYLIDSTQTGD